jgi:hypothetical protein
MIALIALFQLQKNMILVEGETSLVDVNTDTA